MFNSGRDKMTRYIKRILISSAVLLFSVSSYAEDDSNLKSEIELLKQQISQLTAEVDKIGKSVDKIDKVVFKSNKLPNQENFDDDGNIPALGSDDAKIAIVEFSDFECPFCKRFSDNTFDQLKEIV